MLVSSRMKSLCRWKGFARYKHLESNGERNQNAAWTYRRPYPGIRKVKNRIAFSNCVDIVP